MFVQYIVGMEATTYSLAVGWQLAIFILSGVLLLTAWRLTDPDQLPKMLQRGARRWSLLLVGLGAFVMTRYLDAFAGMAAGTPLSAAYQNDVSMFWSIFWLDLGIVVPVTLGAALALFRGTAAGRRALYGVVGWFALVPPSVAAMALVKVLRADPHAAVGLTIMFVAVSLGFLLVAIRLYAPLLAPSTGARLPYRNAVSNPTGGGPNLRMGRG
jgi:hypothetical protein